MSEHDTMEVSDPTRTIMENNNPPAGPDKIPPGASYRRWTLKGKHHHGKVRLSESLLYLDLNCHDTATDSPRHVGVYPLPLRELLADKNIRHDPVKSEGDIVRLRIVREANDEFFVQAKKSGPKYRLENPIT